MNEISSAVSRPRARRLSPQARRAQLLACAVRVLAREGIAGGGHSQVAAEAGVSVPTVFVYFPTREALTEAVLAEVGRFILADVLEPMARQAGPAPAVMVEIAMAFADAIESHPDYARVWLNWSTAFHARHWPMYARFQDEVVALIAAVVARGKASGEMDPALDTTDAAQLLVGSGHMLAQMKFTGQPRERISRFVQSLVAGYLAPTRGPRGT